MGELTQGKLSERMKMKAFRLPMLAAVMIAGSIAAFSLAGNSSEQKGLQKATFAGGCFWCMQPPFDGVPGVVSTVVGYTGGTQKNPTYEEVSSGRTGHAESIEITYDPKKISYDKLLDIFWMNIDPTTPNRQFADAGTQYRTAIFYHNDEQKKLAEASKKKYQASGKYDKPIVTEIVPATTFWPAEEYHQKYYLKNTAHYKAYRKGSGREGYIRKTWGDSAAHH
jgi:methionine-S-sulfoxide reductase